MKYQGTLIVNKYAKEQPHVLLRLPLFFSENKKIHRSLIACFKTGTVVDVFTDEGEQWLLVIRDHNTCYVNGGVYKALLPEKMEEWDLHVRAESNIVKGNDEVLFIHRAGPMFKPEVYSSAQAYRTHLSQPWSKKVWFDLPYHEVGRLTNSEMRLVFSAKAEAVINFSGEMRSCSLDNGRVVGTCVFGTIGTPADKTRYILMDTRQILGSEDPVLPTPEEFMDWGRSIP